MNPLVEITKLATTQLIRMLSRTNGKNVLFSVEGGGCNGLKYKLEPIAESKIHKLDEVLKLNDEKNLVVCNKSLLHVVGTKIDWKEGFMGRTFHFTNPNAQGTCGCGATFNPKM